VALSNNLGTIDAAEYRTGLQPLMTMEETEQYAIQAVTGAASRTIRVSNREIFQIA
jgi:hypothetical protein